jgi:hypothetical protein
MDGEKEEGVVEGARLLNSPFLPPSLPPLSSPPLPPLPFSLPPYLGQLSDKELLAVESCLAAFEEGNDWKTSKENEV